MFHCTLQKYANTMAQSSKLHVLRRIKFPFTPLLIAAYRSYPNRISSVQCRLSLCIHCRIQWKCIFSFHWMSHVENVLSHGNDILLFHNNVKSNEFMLQSRLCALTEIDWMLETVIKVRNCVRGESERGKNWYYLHSLMLLAMAFDFWLISSSTESSPIGELLVFAPLAKFKHARESSKCHESLLWLHVLMYDKINIFFLSRTQSKAAARKMWKQSTS